MRSTDSISQVKSIYREESRYKVFLLAILITGLSYGLYKGMLDNYLAVFYMLSAETLFKVGAIIMLVGMAMNALLPATKVLEDTGYGAVVYRLSDTGIV